MKTDKINITREELEIYDSDRKIFNECKLFDCNDCVYIRRVKCNKVREEEGNVKEFKEAPEDCKESAVECKE
jgi:hypothetical protein